jgi:hypothetical protein
LRASSSPEEKLASVRRRIYELKDELDGLDVLVLELYRAIT